MTAMQSEGPPSPSLGYFEECVCGKDVGECTEADTSHKHHVRCHCLKTLESNISHHLEFRTGINNEISKHDYFVCHRLSDGKTKK